MGELFEILYNDSDSECEISDNFDSGEDIEYDSAKFYLLLHYSVVVQNYN